MFIFACNLPFIDGTLTSNVVFLVQLASGTNSREWAPIYIINSRREIWGTTMQMTPLWEEKKKRKETCLHLSPKLTSMIHFFFHCWKSFRSLDHRYMSRDDSYTFRRPPTPTPLFYRPFFGVPPSQPSTRNSNNPTHLTKKALWKGSYNRNGFVSKYRRLNLAYHWKRTFIF